MWNTNTMHSFFEVIQPNNACKINNDRSSQSPQTGKDANRRGMTHRFRSFTLNSKPECNQYDGENALRAKKNKKTMRLIIILPLLMTPERFYAVRRSPNRRGP